MPSKHATLTTHESNLQLDTRESNAHGLSGSPHESHLQLDTIHDLLPVEDPALLEAFDRVPRYESLDSSLCPEPSGDTDQAPTALEQPTAL